MPAAREEDRRPVNATEETAEIDGALPENLARFIGFLLRRVYARFSTISDGDEADSREFLVLNALADRKWLSQLDLAERLGINRTAMVAVVDRLEEQGLVVRTRNPDNRRSYVLSMTDEGKRALSERRTALVERDARLTAALTPGDAARFDELVARLLPESSRALVKGTENLVTQAHLRLRRLGDDKLAGTGLRVRHYGPLSLLDALGPCSQQELADRMAITGSAASQMVDELADNGLVRRERDTHDRRRYALHLTDLGRERLATVATAVDELAAEVADMLGPDGETELRSLLLAVLDSATDGESAVLSTKGH